MRRESKGSAIAAAALIMLFVASAGWAEPEKSGSTAQADIPAQTSSDRETIPVVDKKELSKYVGKKVSVRFLVDHIHNCHSGKAYLNESHDYAHCFAAVIPDVKRKLFPADVARSYEGKTVQVTGTVEMDFGTPKVILAGPDQVQEVK